MKFEYLIIDGYLDILLSSNSTELLDKVGSEGWELVNTIVIPDIRKNRLGGSYRYTFKRQIPPVLVCQR